MSSVDLSIAGLRAVDLDRHAVIEASAGTGKSYSIENLIALILADKRLGCGISNLLVLTFTDAAASELKMRVRACLEGALLTGILDGRKLEDAQKERLQEALIQYDQAAISTIHGFCQRVLREYAFENGEQFGLELTDDGGVYENALRHVQRAEWPQWFGAHGGFVLELLKFDAKWAQTVLKAASGYQPEGPDGDLLRPAPEPLAISAEMEQFETLRAALAEKITPTGQEFQEKAVALDAHASQRNGYFAVICPLLEWIRKGGCERLTELRKAIKEAKNKPGEFLRDAGLNGLIVNFPWKQSKQHEAPRREFMACWTEAAAGLDKLRTGISALDSIARQIQVHTIQRVRRLASERKQARGQISFSDMLVRLAGALTVSEELRRQLRKQYIFGLIDEFQDTDRIQWSILKTIFLDDAELPPHRRLIVVGDPKQAIYRFRQADVEVYKKAVAEITDNKAGAPRAKRYVLGTCRRSCHELIERFNEFFPCLRREADSGLELDYHAVLSLRELNAKTNGCAPEPQPLSPALRLADLRGSRSVSTARQTYVWFVADETARLLRTVRASDILLLVRSRKEAGPFEAAFAERGIPFSFYKKSGLFDSDEAWHFSYLLTALANPKEAALVNRVWLTGFFRLAPADAARAAELDSAHPFKRRFERWRELAADGRWGRFFQSVLEDSGVLWLTGKPRHVPPAGVSRADSAAEAAIDLDRKAANYRHIAEELEQMARLEHMDLHALAARLERLTAGSAESGEDEDLHRLESERSKVRIMTMHACKGLQAPVVFFSGFFGKSNKTPEYHKYHEQGRLVFDFTQSNEVKHKTEEAMDTQRLIYVAMTRAIRRLYVPYLPVSGLESTAGAGPLADELAPALERAGLTETLLVTPGEADMADPPNPAPEREQPVFPADAASPAYFAREKTRFDLFAARQESFSSLSKQGHASRLAFGESPGGGAEQEDDDISGAAALAASSAESVLPHGARFGKMLHAIFENACFAGAKNKTPDALMAADCALGRLIFRTMQQCGFDAHDAPCRRAVADLVVRALNCELFSDAHHSDPWCLADLPQRDRQSELGFYLPVPPQNARVSQTLLDELGVRLVSQEYYRSGYLTGVIDLVFRRQVQGRTRYYILDWKSNLLPAYTGAPLMEAMREHNYALQYKLYRLALEVWLRQRGVVGGGVSFDDVYGGAYYLFLRGIGKTRSAGGVFYAGEAGDAEDIRARLFAMLNKMPDRDEVPPEAAL